MISQRALYGRGFGYNDMHLIAAAMAGDHVFWVRDGRARPLAEELGVAYQTP